MAEESLLLRVWGVLLFLMIWTAVNYVSCNIIVASVYCWVVVVQHSSPPTLTEAGVPYIVSIFAESLAGNGTKCNVTDFTDELGESCYAVTK